MTNKICWVDEDERIWSPERKLLLGLGFGVGTHNNASDALANLRNDKPDGYHLIILDVMLRQGRNLTVFSDHRTEFGLYTGLVLAEELIESEPNWASKILLFSRTSQADHIHRIENSSKELGVKYLRKQRTIQGKNFVRRLHDDGLIHLQA